MSYASAKGYLAEHLIEAYLRDLAPSCYRPRAGGPEDVGDIAGLPVVISIKNHQSAKLAEWVDDLQRMTAHAGMPVGVVWHKRLRKGHPRDWYVTMTGATFLDLLSVYVRQHDVDPSL